VFAHFHISAGLIHCIMKFPATVTKTSIP